MPYTPQTWVDFPSTATLMSAAKLNYMEAGIQAASSSGSPYISLPSYPSDAGPALRAAINAGGPVRVGPGTFAIKSNGAITATTPDIRGLGNNQTKFILDANIIFLDTSQPWYSFYLADIAFEGGYGVVRSTYGTNGVDRNVADNKVIENCLFYNYTGTAISTNSIDNPDWKIINNHFHSANFTTTMGIALKGLMDSCEISGNEFKLNRVHIKGDRLNNGMIDKNAFLRFGNSGGFPRVDIWIVPIAAGDPEAPNPGNGGVISRNKFGNEFFEAADFKVLIADQGSGTLWGDKFPSTNTASSGILYGIDISQNVNVGSGVGAVPLVRSNTNNLAGMCWGPNLMHGISFAPVLSLRSTSGWDASTNRIGPLVGPAISTSAPGNLVVADSGTPTQPVYV